MSKFLTKNEFLLKIDKMNSLYWKKGSETRWNYMSSVIEDLKKIKFTTSIELGTAGIPLINTSDIIDKNKEFVCGENNKIYLFDARKTPWEDIPDKSYDIFIALQVLEHLTPNQFNVFKEIQRISKMAIISLPYNWPSGNDNHKMIGDDIISKWTDNYPISKKRIHESPNHNRIELFYEFG